MLPLQPGLQFWGSGIRVQGLGLSVQIGSARGMSGELLACFQYSLDLGLRSQVRVRVDDASCLAYPLGGVRGFRWVKISTVT